MSVRTIAWVSGVASTVNTATSTIASFDLASNYLGVNYDNVVVWVHARIVGRNTSGNVGNGGCMEFARGFRRVSGTLTGVDPVVITAIGGTLQTGLNGATFDIAISGTTIQLKVTGIASNTNEWFGDMQLWIN